MSLSFLHIYEVLTCMSDIFENEKVMILTINIES